jgi:hypothetical protein
MDIDNIEFTDNKGKLVPLPSWWRARTEDDSGK